MKPPGARDTAPPAVLPVRIERMRNRRDFLACARGRRAHAPALVLQARPRQDGSAAIRVGFTCSRKLGNAVRRNRARRRLREAARIVLPELGRPGWDYVLIGRPGATEERPFADLVADLRRALRRVHEGA